MENMTVRSRPAPPQIHKYGKKLTSKGQGKLAFSGRVMVMGIRPTLRVNARS
jgi:hypothetical protein